MICSKCGKTIDDNATFCGFCGAPASNASELVTNGAPQGVVPQPVAQNAVPQPTASQFGVPQPTAAQPMASGFGAPQNNAPQYGAPQQGAQQFGAPQGTAPQYGAPQAATTGGGFTLNLAPNVVDIINKVLRGLLAVLAILIIIGSIGTMASIGSIKKSSGLSGLTALQSLIGFSNLARIPAIVSFALALGGAVFAYLTKQRSLFAYIAAGAGLLMFIFNFFLAKFSGIMAMLTLTEGSVGAAVVGSIFLLISAVVMIVCSVVIIFKKEDIVKFKPNF